MNADDLAEETYADVYGGVMSDTSSINPCARCGANPAFSPCCGRIEPLKSQTQAAGVVIHDLEAQVRALTDHLCEQQKAAHSVVVERDRLRTLAQAVVDDYPATRIRMLAAELEGDKP